MGTPPLYARAGELLYLHGSPASRLLRSLARGIPVCLTVTHVDGLVLARSAFHQWMTYRCVGVLCTALVVGDLDEKRRARRLLVEHIVPGRSADTRSPNDFEE